MQTNTRIQDSYDTDLRVAQVRMLADVSPADVTGRENVPVSVDLSADGMPFRTGRHFGSITSRVAVERWDSTGCVLTGFVDSRTRLLIERA